MARKSAPSQPAQQPIPSATEHKLESFAEDLGTLLGTAQNKAENWLGQRKAIAAELEKIRDTASRLLAELTGGHEVLNGLLRRGRPATSTGKRGPGRPKGSGVKKRTMSAAARKKIAAAQRARWARQKAAAKE